MATKIRSLGNACLELIDKDDHLIFNPNYIISPEKGINHLFLTDIDPNHLNLEKINEIKKKFSRRIELNEEAEDEDEEAEEEEDEMELDLIIYGPETVKKETELEIEVLKRNKEIIKLKDFQVEAHQVECFNTEACISYIIRRGDITILFSGNTSKFSKNLRQLNEKIDYCFIPSIEEFFDHYLDFIKEVSPRVIFPHHFKTGEEEKAKNLVKIIREEGFEAQFLEIGDEFEF
ncbi:MAG: hypothetical protein R6U96_06840 [Promethearchaeia archaeon]